LLAHLKKLQSQPARAAASAGEKSVRMQDKPVEVPAKTTFPGAFWRRLRSWIGLN
jgi:hypothetical protein